MYEREFIRYFNYDNDDLKNRFHKMIEIQNNIIKSNEKLVCEIDTKTGEPVLDTKLKVN